MPTQQPTFPSDPFPTRPTPPPAPADPKTQMLSLVHHFGMFHIPPHQRGPHLVVRSVYAEPCMDAAYPEGCIYWLETFRLYEDAPSLTLEVRDYLTGDDLIAKMRLLDIPDLRNWQIFKSNQS